MKPRQETSLFGIRSVFVWAFMFAVRGIAISAEEPPPKDGLLGYELHTPLTVEGHCPYEPRKDVYETLIIQKVNGKTLDTPIKILIENVNIFLPAKTPLTLKGYENAEDRKGVTIKDWKIVAVSYWGIFFHVTEVVSPPNFQLK
jgi:hypothetical protein